MNEFSSQIAEHDAPLTLALDYVPAVNLAFQQNGQPVVRKIEIGNASEEDFHDLVCVISSSPKFFEETTLHLDTIDAGESVAILEPKIPLNYAFLAGLSDAVAGTLTAEIRDARGNVLLQKYFHAAAFSPDQWLGKNSIPELLAAFVTPNLEIITELQSRVAAELERATGDSAIQGYQADRARVHAIFAAIYRAIAALGIRYVNPPASFGAPGQRIRFADAVCKHRLGTCLDLALLFASVMEQCMLHPVILFHKGHAYVGCHLRKNYFPDVPTDDLQTIRKLADSDDFAVVETTMACNGETFAEAEAYARSRHLNADDIFEFAIDIVRARHSGVFPLPILRSIGGLELGEIHVPAQKLPEEKFREIREEIDFSALRSAGTRDEDRTARWRRGLLDLSANNRLLDMRDDRLCVPIACADATKLEDKIAANEMLTLSPLPNLLGEKDFRAVESRADASPETELRELLANELEQKRLYATLPEDELKKRLTELYRRARTDIEESGVNTLFLAVGFLELRERDNAERTLRAPILLMPVSLRRRSPSQGPILCRRDEDSVVNSTLLELLRREHRLEIPGLDPLPCDASGLDVARVFRIFRRAMLGLRGWEVREDVRLGYFSFGKFLMWNDLSRHADAFAAHPVVGHLIGGNGIFDDGVPAFPPEETGRCLDPAKLFCPMNADSSQIAAVQLSAAGKNFVLHGPPGTGKSQTIANIIAHNIAIGRRVLFVAEKKAALDVVQSRLRAVGLGAFCLELHSEKTGKADVLKQFAEALKVADCSEPAAWEECVAELERSRKELNAYVIALHRPFPNGLSAHACFSWLLETGAPFSSPEKINANCLAHATENLNAFRKTAKSLAEIFAGTSARGRETFLALAPAEWSPDYEREFAEETASLADAAENFANARDAFAKMLALDESDIAFDEEKSAALAKLAALTRVLADARVPAEFFAEPFPQTENFVRAALDEISRRDASAQALDAFRIEAVSALDLDATERRIGEIRAKFVLLRGFAERAFLREISGLKKISAHALTLDELAGTLETMRDFRKANNACERSQKRAEKIFGELWRGGSPKRSETEAALKLAKQALAIAEKILGAGTPALARMLEKIFRADAKSFAVPADALCAAHAEFFAKRKLFAEKFSPSVQTSPQAPRALAERLRRVPENLDELRRTLLYIEKREAFLQLGAGTLIEELERGNIAPEDFAARAETAYRRTMLAEILRTEPRLSRFLSERQDAEVRRFREADERYLALSRKIIFAKLAGRIAHTLSDAATCGAALGTLRRECEKRARQKPVRQLLELIRPLVPALKPCFLMSPLSVAQYLSTDAAEAFDIVIFDEASQIPVRDAVGAIARGKQLIVVGDPKQMPPTEFFKKSSDDFDDEENDAVPADGGETDANAIFGDEPESILDECLAAGLFSASLEWHYRSRCESLIAFSNRRYYDDRLTTFPAPRKSPELGVRFEFVPNGVYARRGKRTNRREAEALVAFIFRRLADPAMRKKSMGVVTFNLPQRDLIENLVEKEREKHPEFDEYFGDGNAEKFFVKNLENVQGDERDAILFSVGYAQDESGAMSVNFGPLNRQGGERRLNVAITRAREQIIVFSSIHGSQIDLSRTQAVGAAHLKYFLDYAEKGLRLLPNESAAGTRAPAIETDGAAESVAAFLQAHGYIVKRNVGNSSVRVGAAVADPKRPDEFLLGIEFDGNAYRDCRTARDRDRLRDSVLESLGWKIFRLWTPAWAFDRAHTEKKLLEALGKELRS